MQQLLREDLKWCLTRLPKIVIELMKKEREKVFVSGGFIRSCIANEKINDIDLFTTNKEDALKFANQLANERDECYIYETEFAYTVKGYVYPIQFIHKWTFESPESCVESFDFTIAKTAIWKGKGIISDWCGICDERFYPDLAAHRLIYCNPIRNEEAGGSILRVLKFYQKGYRITLESLGAVVTRLMRGIDLKKSPIITDDEWNEEHLSKVLSGLLREVDPTTDPNNLGHI